MKATKTHARKGPKKAAHRATHKARPHAKKTANGRHRKAS
jgi:hypothetical protein